MVTAGKVLFQFAYVAMATVFVAVELCYHGSSTGKWLQMSS